MRTTCSGALRPVALALLLAAASLGCSDSAAPSPSTPVPAATDAGRDSATSDASLPATKGLTVSNATVASLDGTYDIQVSRFDSANGISYNGNFESKIEIEIDTDLAGVVKTAHFWNYAGSGMNIAPDKFYGCDGKGVACTGVTVDVASNVITLAGPTWPEVEAPAFDGSKADVAVAGGGKVTVSGVIQATKQ